MTVVREDDLRLGFLGLILTSSCYGGAPFGKVHFLTEKLLKMVLKPNKTKLLSIPFVKMTTLFFFFLFSLFFIFFNLPYYAIFLKCSQSCKACEFVCIWCVVECIGTTGSEV